MIEGDRLMPVVLFLMACSVKATFLFAIAWIAASVSRVRSAAFRHSLWAAAIVGALALPLLQPLVPTWHSAVLKNAAMVLAPSPAALAEKSSPGISAMVVNAVLASPSQGKWEPVILLLWAAGCFAFFLRMMAGFVGLRRIYRQSRALESPNWRADSAEICERQEIRRTVRLRQSTRRAAMPVTWGAVRPTILVPANAAEWAEERRLSVLTHELAHIARLDWLLQIFAELARAIYWFHPLAWVAAKEMRRESERACDDRVLNSGVKPAEYARQLLDLAMTLENSGNRWLSALAIARQTNLERRFTAMLNPLVYRGNLSPKIKALVCLSALLLLLPLAALRLPAQDAVKLGGTISDPSGLPVPNATIALSNHKTNQVQMTTSNREGKYSFVGLPAGEYELRVMKQGFAELRAKIMTEGPENEGATQDFTLLIESVSDEVNVVSDGGPKEGIKQGVHGGVAGGSGGGVKEGVRGGTAGGVASGVPRKTIRIRIGGEVQAAKVLEKVQPVYPDKARIAGIDGTVILHAVIGMDGRPYSLEVMNNQIDTDLARAAVEAVSKWHYQPTLLNGDPVEVDTTIKVIFTLAK
jgi:TonB family protein